MKKTKRFIMMTKVFIIMVFFIIGHGYADDGGKIAVAADGKTATSMVSGVAARCPYFLIFDMDGNFLEAMDNPYKTAGRKAGPSVVFFLDQKGVTLAVAGEFGDNMVQAMRSKGIEYVEFRGNAEAALDHVLDMRK